MVWNLEESEGTRINSYLWTLTFVDMITDARVLQAKHVPRDIVHRDAELNHLASALQPLTDDKPAEPVLLSGPSGTGKTCTARYVVERLREAVIDINTQYVNCWENYSRFKTLYQLLDGIEKTFDIHRQSTPTDVLVDRLHDYDGPPYVAILDEADQLEDEDILYDLYRTRRLTLVLIVNDTNEFLTNLPSRVASRLRTSTRITFDPYTSDELASILQDRVRWGLRDGVITEHQLHEIAEQASGDARVAIGTLRAAARRADQEQLGSIPDSFIREGVSEAKEEIKQKNVEMLRPDQRLLYEIITEHGEIRPGDLYERYEDQSSNPRSRRMVRNYLGKLCHYNLIEAKGENRGRTYQPKNTAGKS